MSPYTVQCSFASYDAQIVTVEADNIEDACHKAIALANNSSNWKRLDHCGATFVDACCVGRDEDPWDSDTSLPVPARFTEKGEPPWSPSPAPARQAGSRSLEAPSASASRTTPEP